MPHYQQQQHTFSYDEVTVKLWVPEPAGLKQHYEAGLNTGTVTAFPFWARLWPSAIALSRFIAAHRRLTEGKEVLELAAGLGLPGLVAAAYAKQVVISDYIPEAVEMVQASIVLNKITNAHSRLLDWHALPADLTPDVLLLSDINYDPAAFEVLNSVLLGFLRKGTQIVLTTPQRLMAKPFIEQLLPYCIQQEEITVTGDEDITRITLLVLSV